MDHEPSQDGKKTQTKFLGLDKCIPGRHYVQWVEFPDATGPKAFSYDAEWLSILTQAPTPDVTTSTRCRRPTDEEVARILERFDGDLTIPRNFVATAPPHDPADSFSSTGLMPTALLQNPQTVAFMRKLGIGDHAPESEAIENPEAIDVGGLTSSEEDLSDSAE